MKAGVRALWAAADEVYGRSGEFRAALRALALAYVVIAPRLHGKSTGRSHDGRHARFPGRRSRPAPPAPPPKRHKLKSTSYPRSTNPATAVQRSFRSRS